MRLSLRRRAEKAAVEALILVWVLLNEHGKIENIEMKDAIIESKSNMEAARKIGFEQSALDAVS